MAMPQTVEAVRHPYADGQAKRMLIDGEWVRAASGKTFESRNPATGDLLANVAEGDKEDIDRAVAAARAAFEGPWSKFKPYERQALLLKIADLVEKHYDELALLDTLDMGRQSVARSRLASEFWGCCGGMRAWRPQFMAKPSRIPCPAKSSPTP